MAQQHYVVTSPHRSDYPEPITLKAGDHVSVGQEYDGPEGWEKWYLCAAPGQKDGWVPGQIIEQNEPGRGVITEDYTASELDTALGDRLAGSRILNGWLWAERLSDGITGWVPLNTVRPSA